MALKDVQCERQGCSGRVQFVIDSDEEVRLVSSTDKKDEKGAHYQYVGEECPVCGKYISIGVE